MGSERKQSEKQLNAYFARKRLYSRCMLICLVLAIAAWLYGVIVSPAGSVRGVPMPGGPYGTVFGGLLLLAFCFFVLGARQ
jgi:hypothetical protein